MVNSIDSELIIHTINKTQKTPDCVKAGGVWTFWFANFTKLSVLQQYEESKSLRSGLLFIEAFSYSLESLPDFSWNNITRSDYSSVTSNWANEHMHVQAKRLLKAFSIRRCTVPKLVVVLLFFHSLECILWHSYFTLLLYCTPKDKNWEN